MKRTRRQKLKRILIAAAIVVAGLSFVCLLLYETVELNKRVETRLICDEQGEPVYELEQTSLWGRLLEMELRRVYGRDRAVCYYVVMVLEPAPRESLGKTSVFKRDEEGNPIQAQLRLEGEINCVIEMQHAKTEEAWVQNYSCTLADGTLLFELEIECVEPENGDAYEYHETYQVYHVIET